MNTSPIYIFLTIVVLVIIALFVFLVSRNKGGKEKHLTPLAGLAFAFILAGLFFGENRFMGYGFLGFGVVLAIIDILNKLKKQ
jgi:hypothetical protein